MHTSVNGKGEHTHWPVTLACTGTSEHDMNLIMNNRMFRLQLHAENIVGGKDESGTVQFSNVHCGRVWLEGCAISNRGVVCSAGKSSTESLGDSNTTSDGNGNNGRSDARSLTSTQTPCYWKRRITRSESCRVVLRGRSEFLARDVTIEGDVLFEVPDGHRMEVRGPCGCALSPARLLVLASVSRHPLCTALSASSAPLSLRCSSVRL
jgi:hypothetical protein